MPSYTEAHKRYYQKNKEAINTKVSEKKTYLDYYETHKDARKAYYEANKERIKARSLERYYRMKDALTTVTKLEAEQVPSDTSESMSE